MWQIIGQGRAVSLLQRSLETGSLAHAYLFVGPTHAGKMTLALNLAQALNCPAEEVPCGQCVACQKIVSGRHADVQIIGLSQDKSSSETTRKEIGIDRIREIQHVASLPPFEGRHKVFIIDGAEFLSTEAANCLLKTLEEPADKVVFMLLTANERFLPATVVSRCQRVELPPMAVGEVEAALVQGRGVEAQQARLLARLSRGCPGWAVSALDGALLQRRTEHLDELIDVLGADCEERFAFADKLVTIFNQDRELAQERLNLWLGWWRDLLLVKAGCPDDIVNVDRSAVLADISGGYSLGQIKAFVENIQAAGEQLRQNANPRLALEVLMLNIPEVKECLEGSQAA